MEGRIIKSKKKSLKKIEQYQTRIKQALQHDDELKTLFNRKMAEKKKT